jgi:hypothetical protein
MARTYGLQRAKENERLSTEQVRSNKCQRSRGRNTARKAERIAKQEVSDHRWRSLLPNQQLEELDRRLGPNVGATKQRAKITLALGRLTEE